MQQFSFTEEQQEFRRTVRDLLEKECAPNHVRAMWADPSGRSPELWARLSEVGVVGMTVPVEHGGLGLDEVSLVLLLEEAGRSGLPEPLLETTAVCVPLLADLGAGAGWLRLVASGEAVLTLGLRGQPYVTDAHIAAALLLDGGGSLYAVTPSDTVLTRQPSIDGSRRLYSVGWTPGAGTLLARDADAALATAFDRAALAASAQLVGIGRRIIEMSVQHARDRHQFGRPVGSFQAVKHQLANALLKLEFAAPAVYRAAWSVANRVDAAPRDVSMAKVMASEAAVFAARVGLQVHGAIGYTWEHDLHLWTKKAQALGAAWGSPEWHRRRVAASLLNGRHL